MSRRQSLGDGFSQRSVAAKAGVGLNTYAKIEQGKTLPATRILAKIATALECRLSELVP